MRFNSNNLVDALKKTGLKKNDTPLFITKLEIKKKTH